MRHDFVSQRRTKIVVRNAPEERLLDQKVGRHMRSHATRLFRHFRANAVAGQKQQGLRVCGGHGRLVRLGLRGVLELFRRPGNPRFPDV